MALRSGTPTFERTLANYGLELWHYSTPEPNNLMMANVLYQFQFSAFGHQASLSASSFGDALLGLTASPFCKNVCVCSNSFRSNLAWQFVASYSVHIAYMYFRTATSTLFVSHSPTIINHFNTKCLYRSNYSWAASWIHQTTLDKFSLNPYWSICYFTWRDNCTWTEGYYEWTLANYGLVLWHYFYRLNDLMDYLTSVSVPIPCTPGFSTSSFEWLLQLKKSVSFQSCGYPWLDLHFDKFSFDTYWSLWNNLTWRDNRLDSLKAFYS